MKRLLILTTLVLNCSLSCVAAQQGEKPPPPSFTSGMRSQRPVIKRTLTTQDAVEIALKESPVVRGAEEEVNMAIARVAMAKAGARPALSGTAFLTGGTEGGIFSTPAPVMPPNLTMVPRGSSFDLNGMFMYPLFTGGRLQALVRQAQAARKASDADLEAVKRDLVLEVKTLYRQVLLGEATVDVFKSLTDTTEERLRIDRVSFEQGRIPRFYVLRDEAEHGNAQQMLVNAQRDVDVAIVMLKTVMGVSQESELSLTEKMAYEQVTFTRGELLRRAETQRPELLAARHRVEVARSGITAAKSSYKPQMSLAAMADIMRGRNIAPTGGAVFGVVIGVPILDGGMRRAQVSEAAAQQRKAEQEYEKIGLQVVKDVETAYRSLKAAERNIKTAETVLVSAEEDYRVAQLRYTEGRGINVEVLDALAAFTRARTNLVQALYDYNVSRDQLMRAIGQT